MGTLTEPVQAVPTTAELGPDLTALDVPGLVARHGTPLLVLDPRRVAERYRALRRALPDVRPYYAVKALSHPAALAALRDEGACFDVASPREAALVTGLGVAADRCIHTHPVKKPADLAAGVRAGIRTFVFDCERELDKFAGLEDRVQLLLRLRYRNPRALIDLSYKFGADPGDALDVLDIGGGLPVPHDAAVPHLSGFAGAIAEEIRPLTRRGIRVISEPGRFLAAPAGLAVAAVVGVAERGGPPWYHLDDGVYGSFSNVLSDHVHPTVHAYRAVTGHEDRVAVPSVLAGPTCDSTDVITTTALLPPLEVGDLVVAPNMGACTTVTACEFNGIPRTPVVVV